MAASARGHLKSNFCERDSRWANVECIFVSSCAEHEKMEANAFTSAHVRPYLTTDEYEGGSIPASSCRIVWPGAAFCILYDLHVLPTFCGLCSAHLRSIHTRVMAFPGRYLIAFIYRKISTAVNFCCFVNHNSYGLGNSPSNNQYTSQPSASNKIIHSNQSAIY